MTANKRKGSRHEKDGVDFLLQELGDLFPEIERRALAGVNDKGDIAGLPSWVLEFKNEARIDLAGYMGELEREMRNAKAKYGAAVVKRRTRNVSESYAVMPLSLLVTIIRKVAENG